MKKLQAEKEEKKEQLNLVVEIKELKEMAEKQKEQSERISSHKEKISKKELEQICAGQNEESLLEVIQKLKVMSWEKENAETLLAELKEELDKVLERKLSEKIEKLSVNLFVN